MSGTDGKLRPSMVQRMRARWHRAPLALTFSMYLAAYLAAATIITAWLINVAYNDEWEARFVIALTGDESSLVAQRLYTGPYIYDEVENELVPASEFPITGSDALGVFVGKVSWAPSVSVNHRGERPIYATLDGVAAGDIKLYDWGLNFPSKAMREDVLDYGDPITAGGIAAYDERMRAVRVDVREDLSDALSPDLMMSNVAYYASAVPSQPALFRAIYLVEGVTPFAVYGLLGWAMFRRFYRVHIACPLDEMGEAAQRIAAQDLDFKVSPVRGRELGRLACTLEDMRVSLLGAHRELWRVAEDRRRLNAAFAHDLRTPITVLKGTVELVRLRVDAGLAPSDAQVSALTEQVNRLEHYATAMGGLSRLEDRTLKVEACDAADLMDGLERYASEVVEASDQKLSLHIVHADTGANVERELSLAVDVPLVEEVLSNLLRNACQYARAVVTLACELQRKGDGWELLLCVSDDGPGFSPEALVRGADPFYSENKSAEHFGLGLNIACVLARLHGGAVQLANTTEGGAQVTVTFACKEARTTDAAR